MEIGVFKALEQVLALYSNVAIAWIGALVADLVVNKPLGLRPRRRVQARPSLRHQSGRRRRDADLDVVSITAFFGVFGPTRRRLSAFIALAVAFVTAPADRVGDARPLLHRPQPPRPLAAALEPSGADLREHEFEPEDMAHCPAYQGPICSLCCSLDARCRDSVQAARAHLHAMVASAAGACCRADLRPASTPLGHYFFAWFAAPASRGLPRADLPAGGRPGA